MRADLLFRILRLPRFSDPVEQHQAETAGFVGLTFLAGGTLVLIARLVEPGADHGRVAAAEMLITVLGTSAVLLPLLALRLGLLYLAQLGLVALAFAGVTAGTWFGGAVPSPGLYGYVVVVVSAGILLPGNAALGVAVASLATIFLVVALHGLVHDASAPHEALYHHITALAATTAMTAAIVMRSSQRARTAIARAVTQQRKLERANRELRALEARFDAIARNSREMVAEFDDDARIAYASPNHRDVLGLAPEELIGVAAADLVHPDEVDEASRWPRGTSDSGQPQCIRVRAADGSWRWCEIAASRYAAADGSRRVVTVARDATLRMAAQARELQRRDAAGHAQKMEAIGRLAGGITHELNNLMTVITLNVELLGSALDPNRTTGEHLDHIRESAEHATSLIRRLLSFARPADSARTSVEVNPQARDIGQLLRPLIGETISFELELDPDSGCVEADPSEIGQLLMNLVVNARDAIHEDGRISIRTRRIELAEPRPCYSGPLPPGSYVGIGVCDDGAGMDEETLSRLFEPFFTSRGPDGGTGLGLALVYAIVRRAGGDLSVESRPSEGTRIEAFLPRIEAPVSVQAPGAAALLEHTGGENVLVVEDQARVRAATARVIRSLGYRVFEAGDGEEALELERGLDVPVDLLLTDIVMPGMQGPELARRLLSRRPQMRVIYLTGFVDRAFGPEGSPDHPVLIKPVGRRVLASRLRSVLDGAASAEPAPRTAATLGASA